MLVTLMEACGGVRLCLDEVVIIVTITEIAIGAIVGCGAGCRTGNYGAG